jgi:hypothetical protein
LVVFTKERLQRGQFDSQKSIENSTQQAFAQGVRAGGDDWFKKRLKTVPSGLPKAISAGPRFSHNLSGRKITPAATQIDFKLLQSSSPNGPNL